MLATIADFIREPNADGFEPLALALYRWQRVHNPDYDAFCQGLPEPSRWSAIPAVPVSLYRDLPLTSFPADQARVVFRTSGTTAVRRGTIRLLDTSLYDLGARLHAEACVGPLPRHGISLVADAPDSSLAHMCRTFVPDMRCFLSDKGLDTAAAWAALAEARAPVFVPGTAFAFADLVDAAERPVSLPEGSVVMVTGGFKGRRREVSEAELAERLTELLPGARVVGEYGMSELSSQLWSTPLGAAFVPPPWMRVQAVDPWTGEPVRRGVLRFFDLASIWTVMAIETADVGEVDEQGRVTLCGRLADASPRGCSLAVEEAVHAAQGGIGGQRG